MNLYTVDIIAKSIKIVIKIIVIIMVNAYMSTKIKDANAKVIYKIYFYL